MASRPDITLSVKICTPLQSSSKVLHLGTIELGLWYSMNVAFKLLSYYDANFGVSLIE